MNAIGPGSLAAAGLAALLLPCHPHLGDQAALVVLGDCRQHLADEDARRFVIRDGKLLASLELDDLDAVLAELLQVNIADHEVAGYAVGPLDQHEPDAVLVQPLAERGRAS